jgi:hypothetical protein
MTNTLVIAYSLVKANLLFSGVSAKPSARQHAPFRTRQPNLLIQPAVISPISSGESSWTS